MTTLNESDHEDPSLDRSEISVAIVGCGAISEMIHIPLLSACENVRLEALVDVNRERARELGDKFGITNVAKDIAEIQERIDAVIVAVPHRYHAAVSIPLLRQGIHVLVEKPMASTEDECNRMIDAAREGNAILAIGLMRHFKWSVRWAQSLIQAGVLGKIVRVDAQEGREFNWPVASLSTFSKEASGGGTLADTGAHTLDVVTALLGNCDSIEYLDDNRGGVEAECLLFMRWANGIDGIMTLSRTRRLRNTVSLFGKKGELEFGLDDNSFTIRLNNADDIAGVGTARSTQTEAEQQSYPDLFPLQLEDWLSAIETNARPRVTGEIGRDNVRLIESCYANRQDLKFPWDEYDISQKNISHAFSELQGKRVLVTGATGFIGGRLVEAFKQQEIAVRVVYRTHSRLSRIARFADMDLIHGDVSDYEVALNATQNCDVVLHLGHDFAPKAGRSQTDYNTAVLKNLMRAAGENGVTRFVHTSSISAYGDIMSGTISEASAKSPPYPYGKAKLATENLVLSQAGSYGLQAIVLQPTIVYGPFCKPWTIGPLLQMKAEKILLPDGGEGICNAVYVDDVVQAFLLAATTDNAEAIGKDFLVSGNSTVTWADFYRMFEEVLDTSGTFSLPSSEIAMTLTQKKSVLNRAKQLLKSQRIWNHLGGYRLVQRSAAVFQQMTSWDIKQQIYKEVYEKPARLHERKQLNIPSKERLNLLAAQSHVSIDRARELLGYAPQYPFELGSKVTKQFLRWYLGENVSPGIGHKSP
ncbi:NAD-dependent epimerase/dehydratase family protein [Bremerella sp. JC770]|uniref:NAD-dependent epimerase/dehydratase family protein n=1 Tax=Bremerella sp. JC770 TaxID=3232137 RepID=UPI00345896EE